MNQHQPRYTKGDKIGGRYLVHKALMGGMGEVYLCIDKYENSPYALKTFQGSSPTLAAIFNREVANWIALEKHPNIVRCFQIDTLDNIPFMLLEWVAGDEGRGTALRSWLRQGPLDLALALRFVIDIVRGLQHANQKVSGIVHRDLKPDNVLINQSKLAKITDFGLVTVVQQTAIAISPNEMGSAGLGQSMRVGNIVGTPAYMPPEQWQGETELDFRADIYAVGCILYELLTGQWLYNGRTVNDLRTQHLEAPLPHLDGNFPQELKHVLNGCVAKRREDRFERLDLLLDVLAQVYTAHSDEPLPEVGADTFTATDYNDRGYTYNHLEHPRQAIDDFDKAIQLDPNFASAYLNRGMSYAKLGQHERAINDYDFAIVLDLKFAKAYANRGASYGELGQHHRALEDCAHAICLNPNFANAYYNRGLSYAKLQQYQRAIDDFDKAIQIDPSFASAYLNKGAALANSRRLKEALPYFEKAAAFGFPLAEQYMARARQMLGQPAIQAADNEQEQSLRQFVALYRQFGEDALRQVLKQNLVTPAQISEFIAVVKQRIEGES